MHKMREGNPSVNRTTRRRSRGAPKLATAPAEAALTPEETATWERRDLGARAHNTRRLIAEMRVLAGRAVLVAEEHARGHLTAEELEVAASLDRLAVDSITRALEDDVKLLEERYHEAVKQAVAARGPVDKIGAIRGLRDATGCSLLEAKNAVDALVPPVRS